MYRENAVHKLDANVKRMAEKSPYSSDDEPRVTYTSKQESTLYTLNAATGRMIREVGGDDAMFGLDSVDSCKALTGTGLGGLPEEEECESRSHINIARTDYTITIRNTTTLERVCTIKYSEWSGNALDWDLGTAYKSMGGTGANTYIISGHDGRFHSALITLAASMTCAH